jgi:hypothetical protein
MSPALVSACAVAATANCVNLAILRASFLSIQRPGSKSLISPAIVTSKPVVSKEVIFPMPLFPALSDAQKSSTLFPMGETIPIPVTTTFFFIFFHSKLSF